MMVAMYSSGQVLGEGVIPLNATTATHLSLIRTYIKRA